MNDDEQINEIEVIEDRVEDLVESSEHVVVSDECGDEERKSEGRGEEDYSRQQLLSKSPLRHCSAQERIRTEADPANNPMSYQKSTHYNDHEVPSFRRSTKSLAAPKFIDAKEEFPGSPASKRGVMMKITPKVQQTKFESIFLYDDTVKEGDDYYDKSIKTVKDIPTLFRPIKCQLALPSSEKEVSAVTKRGTMIKCQALQFLSRYDKKIQDSMDKEINEVKKIKKPPIPVEAFAEAKLPTNKGHEFPTTLPPKKSPLPTEVFSDCVKISLDERKQQVQIMEVKGRPPRVIKSPVPFEDFSPSPVKKPPSINENKPIKSLRQLDQYITKKVLMVEYLCETVFAEWTRIIEDLTKIEIDITRSKWDEVVFTFLHCC